MSRLALALAALGYGQSFYYKLGNTIQNYLDYSHEITYEQTIQNNKKCSIATQIKAAFHDDRNVRENQCFLKCKGDANAPGCGNYMDTCSKSNVRENSQPYCFSGSNTLCFETEAQMAALCNSVQGCDSYTWKLFGNKNAGFYAGELGMVGCRSDFVTDGGNKLKFRDSVNTMEGCPLGLGVEVNGGPPDLVSMRGLYEADLSTLVYNEGSDGHRAPARYTHVGADNYNYIA